MVRRFKPKTQPPGPSLGSELLARWRRSLPKNIATQEDAARILDIDHGAMCAFETGYRRPGSKRAERIEEKTDGAVPAESWSKAQRKRAA